MSCIEASSGTKRNLVALPSSILAFSFYLTHDLLLRANSLAVDHSSKLQRYQPASRPYSTIGSHLCSVHWSLVVQPRLVSQAAEPVSESAANRTVRRNLDRRSLSEMVAY
jgi:hypothetical protein